MDVIGNFSYPRVIYNHLSFLENSGSSRETSYTLISKLFANVVVKE